LASSRLQLEKYGGEPYYGGPVSKSQFLSPDTEFDPPVPIFVLRRKHTHFFKTRCHKRTQDDGRVQNDKRIGMFHRRFSSRLNVSYE
jgi:hypothetical protein